jgi:outer membrane receptor protein involved in Fe transport
MRQLFLAVLVCYFFSATLYAQNGMLKGTITDKSTKEPLYGAAVQIVGTYKGTVCDFDGKYEITDIKSGDYTIKISYIGYTEKIYNGIRIKSGETVTLNAELEDLNKTLETVVVVGEQNIVNLEDAKSAVNISAADIKEMNARNVQDLVKMQAGVTETPDGIQIRGGRTYEVQYVVDGINAQDPLSGTGFGVEVGAGSIQNLSVITGGADAEYGDGSSGVIIAQIKEGSDKLQVAGSWQRDNLNFRNGRLKGSSWNTDIASVSVATPIPNTNKKLALFLSGDVRLSDEYFSNLYGKDIRAKQLESSILPDRTAFAPRQDNKWSCTMKWTYKLTQKTKLSLTNQHSILVNQSTRTLQVIGSDAVVQPGLQYPFVLQPDNANTYTHRSNLTVLNISHNFQEKWRVDITAGRLFTNLRQDANGRAFPINIPLDAAGEFSPRTIYAGDLTFFNAPDQVRTLFPDVEFVNSPNGLINNNGIASSWHDHYFQEYSGKVKFLKFTENKINTFSLGWEHKEQEMQWIDVTAPWIGAPIEFAPNQFTPISSIGISNEIWKVKPSNGGFFFQDEIRYKGIVAFLGLRFNYWSMGKFADDAVANPLTPLPDEARSQYTNQSVLLPDGRRYKARLLPRLRVSFPVTDNNVLYFNYGHSMKMAHPRFIYAGLDPRYNSQSFLSDLGNPNLNPEVSVAYEVGIKSQITRDFGVTLSAFYRNSYDFIVPRQAFVRDITGRFVEKNFMINQDYARIRGIELGLNYRFTKSLRTTFNAAYQVATGKSNSAAERALQIREDPTINATKEYYLAWDRPFDIKGALIFTPDTSWRIGNFSLKGFRVFLSASWNSGMRYTPARKTGIIDVLGREEWEIDEKQRMAKIGSNWFRTDLRISRDCSIAKKLTAAVYIEINNLFDNRNAQLINPVTGRAYELGDPVLYSARDPRFPNPQQRGITQDNPARYLAPRQVLYGISFSF